MDKATLEAYKKSALQIKSQAYLKTLEKMAESLEYQEFHQVIREMLTYHIRLEQEKIIAGAETSVTINDDCF